jgi:hypothetical protein
VAPTKLEKRFLAIVSVWIFFFVTNLIALLHPPSPSVHKFTYSGPLALFVVPTEEMFGLAILVGIFYLLVYIIYILLSHLYMSIARRWEKKEAPEHWF